MKIIIKASSNENPKLKPVIHTLVRLGISLHNAKVIILDNR